MTSIKLFVIFVTIYVCESYPEISPLTAIFGKFHSKPPTPTARFRNDIDVKYIEQRLDNFNQNENRTWYMRYMTNDYYFEEGGPIFIFVGGEWEIHDDWLRGGHMFDMAKELKGYMILTEHRYYGRSQPFRTLETSNLKYLDAKQALADLAHFIKTVKATVPGLKNAKVILTGASYSAGLVTWFSRLYPDLVNGAWASSASLNPRIEFTQFFETVGKAFREVGGEACYNRMKNAFNILEEEMDNHRLEVWQKFIKMCPDYDTYNEKNVMYLFRYLAAYFGGMVQIKMDLKKICDEIMSGPDDIQGVGNYLQGFLGEYLGECYNTTYDKDIKEFQKLPVAGIIRPWTYQTCNEVGYYQTPGTGNHPFGMKFPLEINLDICKDAFGPTFTKEYLEQRIEETNKLFGGLNPQVKNVFFTHGALDPWQGVGILCDGDCGRVIPNYAHCNDLDSISSNDTQEMLEAKQKIFEMVKRWLK